MALRGIPVVMYHSVGRDRPDWIWNYLITPVDVFEGQMRALKEENWRAISLRDLYSHMACGTPVPDKPVVLTFDDGYLDNYVYAFPILKKYGHRAAIWMSTDFADPSEDLPPTLEDVWSGKTDDGALDVRGYLSWRAMREMAASGLVELQSHAKTHTWYFRGPRIVDFHRPTGVDGYRPPPWLGWNLFPDRKHLSLRVELADQIPYGTPVYEHGKALVVRRYFEDPQVTRRLVGLVSEHGGAGFFQAKDWRSRLLEVAGQSRNRRDAVETEDQYLERVRLELTESRRAIQDNLGTTVEFLCWPGGGHDDVTRRLAREAGYLATTTHYEDRARRNAYGDEPSEINRIGSGSPCVWRHMVFRRTDPEFFIAGLELFRGKREARWKLRALKAKYLLRYRMTGVT